MESKELRGSTEAIIAYIRICLCPRPNPLRELRVVTVDELAAGGRIRGAEGLNRWGLVEIRDSHEEKFACAGIVKFIQVLEVGV